MGRQPIFHTFPCVNSTPGFTPNSKPTMALGDHLTKLRAAVTTGNMATDAVGESAANAEASASPEYAAEEIFRGSRLVKIRHAGQEYRLFITRNNGLILQK
jgi:hemin uptake protein HemP